MANPQSWNRYSYVTNSPLRYIDPTGHSLCGIGGTGACSEEEELVSYALDMVKSYGGKNDLKAVTRIVDKAAKLYHTYDKMIPALSGVFLGIEESNPSTIWNAAHTDMCAAVGRSVADCEANAQKGSFGDTGFHSDFQDGFSQPFHFWSYLATAANTDGAAGPASYLPGQIVGTGANVFHEIAYPDGTGATWQDFALSHAGMNIGTLINMGTVKPDQLADTIEDYLGADGPGAPYVNPLIKYVPLIGNK